MEASLQSSIESNVHINIRIATREDIPEIVRLLADDFLNQKFEKYENPLSASYFAAFEAMAANKNDLLIVVERSQKIIGTLHMMFFTSLAFQGAKRAQIEGVRIDKSFRGQGIGKHMLEWAINKAREEGCHLIQLTSDKKREQAIKFYKSLGFVATAEGMKFFLNPD